MLQLFCYTELHHSVGQIKYFHLIYERLIVLRRVAFINHAVCGTYAIDPRIITDPFVLYISPNIAERIEDLPDPTLTFKHKIDYYLPTIATSCLSQTAKSIPLRLFSSARFQEKDASFIQTL